MIQQIRAVDHGGDQIGFLNDCRNGFQLQQCVHALGQLRIYIFEAVADFARVLAFLFAAGIFLFDHIDQVIEGFYLHRRFFGGEQWQNVFFNLRCLPVGQILPDFRRAVFADIRHVVLHGNIIVVQAAGFADEMRLQFIAIGCVECT